MVRIKEKREAQPVMSGKKKMTDRELEKLWKASAYQDMKKEAEVFTSEHAQAKAIMHLTESKNPEILTHLKDREITMLATLSMIADAYDSSLMRNWINKFIRYRISLDRKGREEIVNVAKARSEMSHFGGSWNPFRR